MNSTTNHRIEICSDPRAAKAFFVDQTQWIADRQKALQKDFMSPENTLRYSHGGEIIHPAHEESLPGSMEPHSATWELKFDDIKENNLDSWAHGLIGLADEMNASVMGMMFRVLNETTEKVGNVVDAKSAGSFPKAMLEVMEKIGSGSV